MSEERAKGDSEVNKAEGKGRKGGRKDGRKEGSDISKEGQLREADEWEAETDTQRKEK